VALALAFLAWLLDGAHGRPWLAAAVLFLPVALGPALREELSFIGRFGPASRERLETEGPREWRLARDLEIVNEHRRRVSPGAGYHSRTTLVDMEGTYQLDSAGYRLSSRELVWLLSSDGGGPECPWRTLERLDVAYVRARLDFDRWPEPYRRAFDSLPALDGARRVRYLEPGRLAALASTDPACPRPPAERNP
jgi:hypothetical protein